MNLYDFTVKNAKNEDVSLRDYAGRVVLVVNTATRCGFTPQYAGLQKLYDRFRSDGFRILDFPSNQFAGQAPGSNEEIHSFCTLNYHITFPQFAKIDVNGPDAAPLYQWLRAQKPGLFGGSIKWNFTKFLVDGEGKVVRRYGPATKPETIERDVERLLHSRTAPAAEPAR